MKRCLVFLLLVLGLSGGAWSANPGDVVINEVYCNTADTYDGSEFIELYNTTPDSIDLTGWVITSIEYDQICGEHHHELPAGSGIPGHGYFVIVRDVADGDGFVDRFGMRSLLEKYGVEMYDPSMYYEVDDPYVRNTIVQNPDNYDDQIRLYPGTSDYGAICGTGRYEVIFLYDSPSRTRLIDAMEYRSTACTYDYCSGVNGENDAYPRYPSVGISLGRDESSTDTDNSAADFYEIAPSPFAQNRLNQPPNVWSLRYSPCVPKQGETIRISCYVVDRDGSVTSVKCFYTVELPPDYSPAPYDSVLMSPANPGDSLYVCNLPSQIDQTHLRFYVRAIDNMGAARIYPGDAPQGAYCCFVGIAPISSIQWVEMGDDSSYVQGQARNITGIVTAGRGVYKPWVGNLFVVQDGTGPWSGIYVYDPTMSLPAETGDSVTISGKVIEYYGLTELMVIAGCYEEHSSGHALPAPIDIPTSYLSAGSPYAESYEGVLVRVNNVTVTNDSLGYGEWEINDGSGACIVDDEAYYFYKPRDGDVLESITGVVYYSYGAYKLEPRGDEDIVGPPVIYSLRYQPHAPGATDLIRFSCVVKGVHPITTVKLYYSTDGGASFDSTLMAGTDSIYTAQIGPYANGTEVDYYVQVWDDTGLTGRKPASGTYDLRVGMNTIYEVQYVPAGGDSSSLAGKPVNVAGIVTAGTGEYSNNYFYIQNSYGSGSPAFKGIKVYDRTGTVMVSRGDSVTVSGDVLEYYGETEIAMFFPEAITIHSRGNQVPPPYAVSPTAVNTEEQWEGVLVRLSNVEVIDPNAGFGEWIVGTIGNPADSCRVGDYGSYTYVPSLGEDFGYIIGICNYAYGTRMLQPRDDNDICAASEAGNQTDRQDRLVMFVRPNPTLEGVTVKFALPEEATVSLRIYDVRGALVKVVSSGRIESGTHSITWDGRNQYGERVASGVYFVRLETSFGTALTKIVVSR